MPGQYSLNADGSKPFTLASVKFTRDYIDAFEAEAAKAKDSAALIAAMKTLYPGLSGGASPEIGVKARQGRDEMACRIV